MSHKWNWFKAGRMRQAAFTCGDDVAALAELDRKQWVALSMPTTGVRFDLRMLELMDADHDGRIRRRSWRRSTSSRARGWTSTRSSRPARRRKRRWRT